MAFFDANGVVLALFGHDALAEDAHLDAGAAPAFRGVCLAWNAASEAEVDAILAHALACGARSVKPPQKVFWGGYSGYFADPDGHLWEVAYNPFFPLSPEGRIATAMNHDTYSPDYIRAILQSVKTIALVGASSNAVRPSYFVMKYLLDKGYEVIPVNPGLAGQELLGQTVYGTLKDIPEPIDMVDIFRNSEAAGPITDEALALDPLPKVIWMQLSVRNDEAAARRPRRQGFRWS